MGRPPSHRDPVDVDNHSAPHDRDRTEAAPSGRRRRRAGLVAIIVLAALAAGAVRQCDRTTGMAQVGQAERCGRAQPALPPSIIDGRVVPLADRDCGSGQHGEDDDRDDTRPAATVGTVTAPSTAMAASNASRVAAVIGPYQRAARSWSRARRQ